MNELSLLKDVLSEEAYAKLQQIVEDEQTTGQATFFAIGKIKTNFGTFVVSGDDLLNDSNLDLTEIVIEFLTQLGESPEETEMIIDAGGADDRSITMTVNGKEIQSVCTTLFHDKYAEGAEAAAERTCQKLSNIKSRAISDRAGITFDSASNEYTAILISGDKDAFDEFVSKGHEEFTLTAIKFMYKIS